MDSRIGGIELVDSGESALKSHTYLVIVAAVSALWKMTNGGGHDVCDSGNTTKVVLAYMRMC